MKTIAPGGNFTTCVYPGGFFPPTFRNCLFIFFAGAAVITTTNASSAIVTHILDLRTAKEYRGVTKHCSRIRTFMWALMLISVCCVALCGCAKKHPEDISLTPADSLKSMRLSEDFHLELFAAEPEVMSPVEMVFDEGGRIYVAEMLDYPDDPPQGKPARSRIRLIEDSNGDGKIDRSTVFADQVLAVSGIMPWKSGLIVTSAPDILFMKDENGDGKADSKKVLYTGFPRVNQEARITNPRLASDNWIYFANAGSNGTIKSPDHPEMPPVLVRGADFRFDPSAANSKRPPVRPSFGIGIDDWGNRFITQNTTHIRHVVLPMEYVARAHSAAGCRGDGAGYLRSWTPVGPDVSAYGATGVAAGTNQVAAAAL